LLFCISNTYFQRIYKIQNIIHSITASAFFRLVLLLFISLGSLFWRLNGHNEMIWIMISVVIMLDYIFKIIHYIILQNIALFISNKSICSIRAFSARIFREHRNIHFRYKKAGIRPMIHGFIISALVVIVALLVEIAIGIV